MTSPRFAHPRSTSAPRRRSHGLAARHQAEPPGPRLPAAVQSTWLAQDPVGFLEQNRRRFGDVFSLRLLPVGRVVVVGSPALVHAVLTGSSDRFRAGAATARLLPFLGACSPLLLDGDEHRTQRRRLLRAFSAHGAAGDRPAIEAIVRRHVERWPRGRPFTSLPATRALAFEVVVRRAIGLVDVELDDLERRLQRLLNGQAKLAVWGSTHSRPRLGLDPQAVLERRLAALDAVLTAGMDGAHRGGGVLAALAGHGDEPPIPQPEAVHVVRALALVGHETTGTAASWVLQLLAHHPAAAEQARDATVSGDEGAARSWLEEALRVHPPVVDAIREVAEDMELGGYVVRARTIVMAAPLLLHTRADIYPRPYEFRPERFVDRRPDPAAWIPFGGGVRRCLGATLAARAPPRGARALPPLSGPRSTGARPPVRNDARPTAGRPDHASGRR